MSATPPPGRPATLGKAAPATASNAPPAPKGPPTVQILGPSTVELSETQVVPFWHRMPKLFLFPLQKPSLVRIVATAVIAAIAAALAFQQMATSPFLSGVLLLAILLGASLYVAQFGFLVIERTSTGYLDSRLYPNTEDSSQWIRPVKMFLVLVLAPVGIGILGAFLPGFIVKGALLVFALLLPASAMVMTVSGSLADAINPAHCTQVALKVGKPYLLLCVYLYLLIIGSHEAVGVLLPHPTAHAPSSTSMAAAFFVLTLVGNYFLVLTCVLIGYVMFQYSGALGIDVIGPGDVAMHGPVSSATHERRKREAMIGKLVATGEIKEAIELLSDELRLRPHDLSVHVRLHKLLLHEGAELRIRDHAEKYLELLLGAGDVKGALELLQGTRARFPQFTPREPAQLPVLAAAALDAQQPALATELIRGFDKRFPGHPAAPQVYVVGGRIMLQAQHDGEARKLFEYVRTNFPNTPASAEAARYLARFSQTGAAPAT